MTAWMLYAAALSAALCVAALAAERALRLTGGPMRLPWALAMAASLALPFVLPRAADPSFESIEPIAGIPVATDYVVGDPTVVSVEDPSSPSIESASIPSAWTAIAAKAEGAMPYLWIAASIGLLVALAAAAAVLARRRRGWEPAVVSGAAVLLSERTGPAVVGFIDPAIVLPRWAMQWSEPLRRLIVRHEREHVDAGDPRLLLAALVAVALMPWNPALWWQLRRLRLAVEIDCDTRTLRRDGDVSAYGLLLLEVGRRGAGAPLPVAAFSEPRSFLERRIRVMTSRTPRNRAFRLAALALVAAGAAVGAAALPAPALPLSGGGPDEAPSLAAARASAPGAMAGDTTLPVLANVQQLSRAIEAQYPPLLRDAGIGGTATVRMRVGEDGQPGDITVVSADRAELGEAALRAMASARFRPARVEGRAVPYRLTLPVMFQPDGGEQPPALVRGRFERDTVPVVALEQVDEQPRIVNTDQVARAMDRVFPPLLRDAGIRGEVSVRVLVRADGGVGEAEVVSSTHPELRQPALDLVRQIRFSPARRGGRAVPARIVLPLTFRSRDPRELAVRDEMERAAAEMREHDGQLERQARVLEEQARRMEGHARDLARARAELDAQAEGGKVDRKELERAALEMEEAAREMSSHRGELARAARELETAAGGMAGRREEMERARRDMESAAAEMAGRREEMKRMERELQVEAERMRRESEQMRRRIREEMTRRQQGVLQRGTADDEYVFFVADEQGRVKESGIGKIPAGEVGRGWSSNSLVEQIESRFRGTKVVRTFHWSGMEVRDGGPTANVAWVTVEG